MNGYAEFGMISLIKLALVQNPAMTPPPVAEWPGAEIVEGVAFQGDGAIAIEASPEGVPVLTFWRPVLHDEDTRYPIAGRMDCRVVATQAPFDAAGFDPEARHSAVAKDRKEQGFIDTDRKVAVTDTARQIDIIGRRNGPRTHYVLSYIMIRDRDRMIDIRRNCVFIFGSGASRPDVLPYVNRYTRFITAFSEQDS